MNGHQTASTPPGLDPGGPVPGGLAAGASMAGHSHIGFGLGRPGSRWEGHAYTQAYAYQLVIGRIGGWALPFPLALPQAITLIGAVVALVVSARSWYPLTGPIGAVVAVVMVGAVVHFVGAIRPEGRSVLNWLSGYGSLILSRLTGPQIVTPLPLGFAQSHDPLPGRCPKGIGDQSGQMPVLGGA